MKISVITATFNSEKTIDKCLTSLSSQTYKNIEHIIVDGKSTDKTLVKIRNHSYKSTKVISEPDKGIYDALNKGIKNSSGDIIGFLHSDDYYSNQNVLEKIYYEFKKNSKIKAVYGDIDYVSSTNNTKIIRKWRSRNFEKKLLSYGWMPPHTSLYIKKEYLELINGFDTRFKISADYASIIELFAIKEFTTKYIPEVLIKMQLGGASNQSLSKMILKTKEDWKALRINNYNFYNSIRAIIFKNFSKLGQFF